MKFIRMNITYALIIGLRLCFLNSNPWNSGSDARTLKGKDIQAQKRSDLSNSLFNNSTSIGGQ